MAETYVASRKNDIEEENSFLDRIGIPYALRWGFLGVLIFMMGDGVESNFIATHITHALHGADASLAKNMIAVYGIAVIVASYLAGALSDLFGPKRVMALGFVLWMLFEVLFLWGMGNQSVPVAFSAYALRGFGFPLFAFAFLTWINITAPDDHLGAAIGWFYTAFTGGLATLGSVVAMISIPLFGGGVRGEQLSMWLSCGLVVLGFVIVWFGVRLRSGVERQAPPEDSTLSVLASGLTLGYREPKIVAGLFVRLVNTAPQFGMTVILPTVMAVKLGWGQERWLLMTSLAYFFNLFSSPLFGTLGDRWGWLRTVRTFGLIGSAIGLLAWWYIPHWVPRGSDWGFYVSILAAIVFTFLLGGFTPMGAIMTELAPVHHRGAAMAMYGTAAGGAAFLGPFVVAVVSPWWGNEGVVWTFVGLYVVAFFVSKVLTVDQHLYDPKAHQHYHRQS